MKDLLKKMTYGHYILTALKEGKELKERDEDYLAAGTVNWATQISFEPVQIAVAVGQNSDLNETIDYSGYFTLHLLSSDHKNLVEKFAGRNEVSGGKINGISYKKEKGELILPDSLGFIKCEVKESYNTGDHRLYIGEAMEMKSLKSGDAICTMNVPAQYTPEKAEV